MKGSMENVSGYMVTLYLNISKNISNFVNKKIKLLINYRKIIHVKIDDILDNFNN